MLKNRVNGLAYVGITTRPMNQRMANHVCNAFTKKLSYPLYRAIREYGMSAFDLTLLGGGTSIEDLHKAEIQAIQRYGTLHPAGYNATLGGEGTVGRKCSEATKAKIAAKATGRPCPESAKVKISKHFRGRVAPNKGRKTGKPAWNRGKHHSEESKSRMSARQLGIPKKSGRPVVVAGIRYEKLKDAAAVLGLSSKQLWLRLKKGLNASYV